jgi:hypothetical protein
MEYIILSGSLEQANLLVDINNLADENYYIITKENINQLNKIIDSRLTYIELTEKNSRKIDDIQDYIKIKRNNHKEYLLTKDYSRFDKLNKILSENLNVGSYKEVCYKLQKQVTDSGYVINDNIRNTKVEIIYNFFTLLYLSNFGFANSIDMAKHLYDESEQKKKIISINNIIRDLQNTILCNTNNNIVDSLLENECLNYGNI